MKILIAYATVYGSTREVAEKVGQVLKSKGHDVDVASVAEVTDLSSYHAAVIGAPVMKFSFLPPAKKFVKRNAEILKTIPVAYFSLGFKMIDYTPEGRDWMMRKLKAVTSHVPAVDIGLFGGKYVKPEKGLKMPFPEGDWRDWEKIEAWAEGLSHKLKM